MCVSMVSFSLENITKIFGWGMQLLVSFIFHDLPSLHPSSFQRNDFLNLFHLFFGMHCNINGGKPPEKNSAICRLKHCALVAFRAVARGEHARGRPLRNWKAELTKWRRTTLTFRNSLPFYRVYLELTEADRLVPMHTSADHGAVLYENQTLYSLQ